MTTLSHHFFPCTVDSGIGMLFIRMAAGISTGCLAILSAQPTDVVKIRMQAEVRAPGQKSRYNGVIHAYVTIAKTEGMRGLYKGRHRSTRSTSAAILTDFLGVP